MNSMSNRASVICLGNSNSTDSASSAAMCLQENLNPALRLKLAQSIQRAVSIDTDLQASFAAMLRATEVQQKAAGFTLFNFLIKKNQQADSAGGRCLTKRVAAAIALLESPYKRQALNLLLEVAHIPYKQLPKGAETAANYARQYVYRANLNAMRCGSLAA